MMKTTALLALAAAASTGFAQTEVSVNGGFEAGDTSGWVSFPTATSTFTATNDPAEVNDGSWAGVLTNGDSAAGAVVKQANLAVGLVNPGDTIEISFSIDAELAAGGVIIAEFFSELAGGGTSSSEILGGAPILFSSTGGYVDFSFTTTAGPNVDGGITLQFVAATGAAQGSFAQAFIDNVSVVVVPSPAGVAMLGAGGLLVARRRR